MRTLRGGLVLLMTTSIAFAGGDWKDSPLHQWFEGLSSKIGLCRSNADGVTLTDVQWDMQDGHYRVVLDSQWIVVPDEAIVVEQTRFGQAVVWPWKEPQQVDAEGEDISFIRIRCFMPGPQA